jgi:protein TonB
MKPFVFSKAEMKKGPLVLSGMALLLFVFCIAATASAATEYSASDVDSPPKIIRQMPVQYPAQAKKNGITGKVIVRCLVGVDGKADKLEIVESDPEGIFEDSALSTLKYWQFRPGIKGGELVATWVKVPFKFE